MPVPVALPLGLFVGMVLAWLARAELARSEVPLVLARPFLVALALGALVQAPIVGYFAARHGDWSYLYLVRAARVPSAVDLLAVLACGAQVPLGFALMTPWAMAKRGAPILYASAAAAMTVGLVAVLAARRLGVSASYAQFHGGFGGAPIGRTSLGRALLLSWTALAAAYGWSAWALRAPRPRGGAR